MNVFKYNDYRKLLKDLYKKHKEKKKARISHRIISKKLGGKSSAFFNHLCMGKVALKKEKMPFVTSVFHLSENETRYLEKLVEYNHTENPAQKKHLHDELIEIYSNSIEKVGQDRGGIYSKWYHTVIRCFVCTGKFDGDFKKLSRMLIPAITEDEAKGSVAFLLKHGFIKANEDGTYYVDNPSLTSDRIIIPKEVYDFQLKTIEMAKESFARFERPERESATLTLAVSEKTYQKLKAEMMHCRKKFLNIAEQDENPERVYQLNFQTFPLTERF